MSYRKARRGEIPHWLFDLSVLGEEEKAMSKPKVVQVVHEWEDGDYDNRITRSGGFDTWRAKPFDHGDLSDERDIPVPVTEELARLAARVAEARHTIGKKVQAWEMMKATADRYRSELAEVKAERDRLREALERANDPTWEGGEDE